MMKINYLHVAFLSLMSLQNLTAHSKPTAYGGFDRGNAVDSTIPIRNTAINTGCRHDDSLQLVRLYQTTNGANWTRKWLLNTPIHIWAGVHLTPQGCVKNINLTRNQLVGTIPNLNLPKLQTLILVDNALTGAVPSFNLPELRVLNLSLNQLTGAIPVFNVPQLTDLHLNFNRFTGAIPILLSPNLKFLHLEGNFLSGAIPAFTYPLLEELLLRTNRLTGPIPNFNLPQLRTLHLELNFLTGTIPNFNLPFLRELLLDDNQLTGAIPNFNLPMLETLGLETNQLSGQLPLLNLMPKLKLVLLARNRFTGEIPDFHFPNLVALQLNNNLLTGCIPLKLKSLCGKFVDLSGNPRLQNQNFATFCSNNAGLCLGESCRYDDSLQLVRLYQATNGANWTRKWFLNTPINTWAGVHLTPQGCVKNINLTRNQLVGTIPNLNLPKLQTLILVDNALTGAVPNFNLPELRVLNLSLNQLTGAIPVFNVPQLTDLHLNFNRFTGAIPILLSPNLKFLHLEGNFLSGAIPAFTYPLLEELLLRTNRLTGTIPNFNLPQLRTLHLELNALTGTIPNFNLPFLRELWLDDNQLTGAIPNFNLPMLETLGLETNQLSGQLPLLNLMPKLKLVLLARNRLTGSLPPFKFPNLVALQLNNNLLTGCIPIEFRTFCAKYVDLSANLGLTNQNFATFCSGNFGLCNPLLPDLTMANLNLTNSVVAQGQILHYKFDLKNIGSGNAPSNFNVKGYISKNNVFNINDIQSGIVPTANFAAGFSVLQVPASSMIPATLAPGQYYLILKADADNQIAENNENNNLLVSSPFQVTAPNNNKLTKVIISNSDTSQSKSITYNGIDSLKQANFSIFPNPATQEAFLDLKDFENQLVELKVSDVAGKVLFNQTIEKVSSSPHRLNTSTLNNGTYFIEIQSVGKRITRQLYILN
jgi:CARDB/Secretion system C-terminal sorting domain